MIKCCLRIAARARLTEICLTKVEDVRSVSDSRISFFKNAESVIVGVRDAKLVPKHVFDGTGRALSAQLWRSLGCGLSSKPTTTSGEPIPPSSVLLGKADVMTKPFASASHHPSSVKSGLHRPEYSDKTVIAFAVFVLLAGSFFWVVHGPTAGC